MTKFLVESPGGQWVTNKGSLAESVTIGLIIIIIILLINYFIYLFIFKSFFPMTLGGYYMKT
jgi:hypothetical protein